jgi:hypothetical protein
MNFEEEG